MTLPGAIIGALTAAYNTYDTATRKKKGPPTAGIGVGDPSQTPDTASPFGPQQTDSPNDLTTYYARMLGRDQNAGNQP